MIDYRPKTGLWLSDASMPAAEIAALAGYDFVVLDVEHGAFGLESLERYIPAVRGLGLKVFCKVLGPAQEPVQQALDFGADGVIVPHVRDAEHAREVSAYAKFPPRGLRSVAGGRVFGYAGWTDERTEELNANTLCFPLIEDPRAVGDIEEILALETVDGFQMGPGDLSMLSGRGAFRATEADWVDINRCADAAVAAGKPWMYPAWTHDQRIWALRRRAPYLILEIQYHYLMGALRQARGQFDELVEATLAEG